MNLFKWLKKQYEKLLPYKIVDVAPEELSQYLGGIHPIVCQSKHDRQKLTDLLRSRPDVSDWGISDLYLDRELLVIWHYSITDLPKRFCKRTENCNVWLRVNLDDWSAPNIDDLI